MKNRRNLIVILLSVLIVLTFVVGCEAKTSDDQSNVEAKATDAPKKEEAKPSDEPINSFDKKFTITWFGFNEKGNIMQEGTPVELKLEELYNIDIIPILVDSYNSDQVNIMLGSSEIPDFFGSKGISGYVKNGILRPVSKELMEQYCPDIVIDIDTIDPSGTAWRKSTFDGVLYGVPDVTALRLAGHILAIRSDWMENVGVTEDPKTLDELEVLYTKFRNEDPNKSGVKDTYAVGVFGNALTNEAFGYVFGAFGINQGHWFDMDGKLAYANVTDNYKEALKVLNSWYVNELIDPDFVIDGRAEFTEKFSTSQIGAYNAYARWTQNAADTPIGKLLAKNPDAKYKYIQPVTGPDGKSGGRGWSTATGTTNAFGVQVEDDLVARVLMMQNDIFTDISLYRLANNGIEGVHFDIDEAGQTVFREEFASREGQTEVGVSKYKFHMFQNEMGVSVRLNNAYKAPWDYGKNIPLIVPDFEPVFTTDTLEKSAEIKSIVEEFYFKAITGEYDIDTEWEVYLERLNNARMDLQTKEANEQYALIK